MSTQLPKHIAIIMDGNGRWAAEKKRPRIEGHRVGAESVRTITTFCANQGVEILTLYAFSQENWIRPLKEVSLLMRLLDLYIKRERSTIMDNNIQLRSIGDTERLPSFVKKPLQKLIDDSAHNDGMIMQLALSYGGRDEILRAAKKVARDAQEGKIDAEKLTEDDFSRYLDTGGQTDPDLLIRTGGDQRISNYLLWQSAYAELYFTPTFWPDFKEKNLLEAVDAFYKRKRRFGGLDGQTKESLGNV